MIRDVPTGRYLDVDKLHYIDFENGNYSVKGPSIIPRPPQGQLPVLAPAGLLTPEAVAAGAADALLVSAPTPELLAAELAETRAGLAARERACTDRGARRRAGLPRPGRRGQAGRAEQPHRVAEPACAVRRNARPELTELLTEVLAWADGVRLHPAVLDTDLEELRSWCCPSCAAAALLAPNTRGRHLPRSAGAGTARQPLRRRGNGRNQRPRPGKLRSPP